EDTGIGIAADECARIFERFHRVKGAASRSHEGTGIGLSLVRELVQQHGGSIRVESDIGRGSRFIVTVKAGTAHLPAEHIAGGEHRTTTLPELSAHVNEVLSWLSAPSNSSTAADASEEAARPARLLLADDNADMRRYITRLLEPYYEVSAVPD